MPHILHHQHTWLAEFSVLKCWLPNQRKPPSLPIVQYSDSLQCLLGCYLILWALPLFFFCWIPLIWQAHDSLSTSSSLILVLLDTPLEFHPTMMTSNSVSSSTLSLVSYLVNVFDSSFVRHYLISDILLSWVLYFCVYFRPLHVELEYFSAFHLSQKL